MNNRFSPDIEGLRAVAILAVMAYHTMPKLFTGGFVGVDVFFVISGFLIFGILLREANEHETINVAKFFARRGIRLMPAAVTTTTIVLLVGHVLSAPWELRGLINASISALFYFSNLWYQRQAADYLADEQLQGPLLHTWSLSIEEQFYFLAPLILLLLLTRKTGRFQKRVIITLLAAIGSSLCFASGLVKSNPAAAYFSLPARVWEFALGGLVSLLPTIKHAGHKQINALVVAGLIAIFGSMLCFSSETDIPAAITLIPTIGTSVILFAVRDAEPKMSVLRHTILRWIGRISYGWYLWHWPFIFYAQAWLGRANPEVRIVACVAALVPATLSYQYIELPLRKNRALLEKPWHAIAMCTSIILLAGGLALWSRNWKQISHEGILALEAARNDLPSIYFNGCHLSGHAIRQGACTYGSLEADTTIVLFGDSHAAQWFPGLESVSKSRRWRLMPITKSGCAAIPTYGENEDCSAWRKLAHQKISTLQPVAILIASYSKPLEERRHRKTTEAQWEKETQTAVSVLLGYSTAVAIITDTPRADMPVPGCLARALMRGDRERKQCEIARTPAADSAMAAEKRAIAGLHNARMVNFARSICSKIPCQATRHSTILMSDAHHLTAKFSEMLAPEIEKDLDAFFDEIRIQ